MERPVGPHLTIGVMGPGLRQDDQVERATASHCREQLVAAIIGVEFSAALALDRGAARGGGCVLRHTERAAQAVGAAAGLAGGKRRA